LKSLLVARQAWLRLMVKAFVTQLWVKWWLNYLFFGKGSGADSELLVIGVRVVVLVKRRGVGRKVSW
jgi:hypothetical protein